MTILGNDLPECAGSCVYCHEEFDPQRHHPTDVDYTGNGEILPNGEIAVRCVERVQCQRCGEWTVLRQGTGYWRRLDWDAEQDATRIEWDEPLPERHYPAAAG